MISDIGPSGRGIGTLYNPGRAQDKPSGPTNGAGKKPGNNGINYHGGPVMLGQINVYYIWYGNWTGNTANSILTELAQNIGGSRYFNINTTYTDGSNRTRFETMFTLQDRQPLLILTEPHYLTDQIEQVVANAIGFGRLPRDTNGVYFVLTSADVTGEFRLLQQLLRMAHPAESFREVDIKYSVHRKFRPLYELMCGTDHRTERQCRCGRDGVHHCSRTGRSRHGSRPECLV